MDCHCGNGGGNKKPANREAAGFSRKVAEAVAFVWKQMAIPWEESAI
jgi:hypothetical protein